MRPENARRRWTLGALLALVLVAAPLLTGVSPAHAATGWTDAPATVPDGPPEAEDVGIGIRPVSTTAVDRAGNAWFAWTQSDDPASPNPNAATWKLRVAYRPAGAAWQPPSDVTSVVRAAGTSYDTIVSPRLAVDAKGTPTLVWAVAKSTGYVVRSSVRTGGAWSTPVDVGTTTMSGSNWTTHVSLTLDVAPSGLAAVAYQELSGTRLAVRDAAGVWAAPETVDTAAASAVIDTVGLGRDQDGILTVLWRTGTNDNNRALVSRTRTPEGGWSAPVTLTTAGGRVARPSLAVDATGAAVATWGTADGARAAVRPTSSSTTWAAPTVLSSGTPNAAPTAPQTTLLTSGKGVPSAAFDVHGNATVVWPEGDDSGAGTPARIRARGVTAAGVWSDTVTVANGDATTPPIWPRVTLGPDGQATAVWTRNVSTTFPGGVVQIAGGEIVAASRATATGEWGTPRMMATTNANSQYASATALGTFTTANLNVSGDPLGNVLLGYSPYYGASFPSTRLVESFDHRAAVTPRLDWTARGVTGSSNIRTWVNYLRTNWPGPGPAGPGDVETTAGASQPDAGDRSSWRLTQQDVWRDSVTGKVIVQYAGTIRWVNAAHFIDIRFVNPRLEIAVDEQSARLYSDGTTSGSMADAMSGHATSTPFTHLRVLDLDLSAIAGPRTSGDGAVRSWVGVPAKLATTAAGDLGLTQYAQQPFGYLTFSTAAAPETRTPPVDPPPVDPPIIDPPIVDPPIVDPPKVDPPKVDPPKVDPPKVKPLAATLKGAARKRGVRTVTITLAKRLGTSKSRVYKVALSRSGSTVATGRLKDRTLTLTVRKSRGKYARITLKREYVLSGTTKPRIAKTTIRIG